MAHQPSNIHRLPSRRNEPPPATSERECMVQTMLLVRGNRDLSHLVHELTIGGASWADTLAAVRARITADDAARTIARSMLG